MYSLFSLRNLSVTNKPLFICALIVFIIAIIVIVILLTTQTKTPENLTDAYLYNNIDPVPEINDTRSSFYSPVPAPTPVNDTVLTATQKSSALPLNNEKTIIEKMKNAIITLDAPAISTNFRLYGKISSDGHIYLYNNNGICVVDVQIFTENTKQVQVLSNISGHSQTTTLNSVKKSFHFVIDNYKIYLNGTLLGELHSQHNVQYIQIVDNNDIKEIQLIDLDPNISLLEIGNKSLL